MINRFLKQFIKSNEFGATVTLIVIWGLFAIFLNNVGFNSFRSIKAMLELASVTGILAVPSTLLLISGEFDLSIGSMLALSGLLFAICVTKLGMSLWVAVIVVFAFALLFGFIQGGIVVKTRVPSLIVSLGMLFFLRGITYGVLNTFIGRTDMGGFGAYAGKTVLYQIFAGKLGLVDAPIIWWFCLTIVGMYILNFTTFGNWIFSTGGSNNAARALGVPVNKVKIILFMATSVTAALLGLIQVFKMGSADAMRGLYKEMEVVITVVLGGTLIVGGAGSPLGTLLACITLAVLRQGIFFTNLDFSWYQSALGVVLIIAILINRYAKGFREG